MDQAILQAVDLFIRLIDSKSTPAQKSNPAATADPRHKEEIIRGSPAVKFLTRTDFFSLVQYSDVSISNHIIDGFHVCLIRFAII